MAQFDESRVINALHMDKAEVGKKYWFSDDIVRLKTLVETNNHDMKGILDYLTDNSAPFRKKDGCGWSLLYPYEEPVFRPYKDTEEMINDFCERFGVKRTNFGEPFIWIVDKTCKRLIISYDLEIENITMQDLLDNFTYLDGSVCGVINC